VGRGLGGGRGGGKVRGKEGSSPQKIIIDKTAEGQRSQRHLGVCVCVCVCVCVSVCVYVCAYVCACV
jgi:hypothetical protein